MMKKTAHDVSPEESGERLDIFISLKSDLTRSHIHKLIMHGQITVNGRNEKAGYRIRGGDRIEVVIPDEPEGVLLPEDIPLEVLWEDEFIIVVNKPPGMVIYPAAGNCDGTMMNALVARCERLSSIGAPLRPGVVHRLDKDTSGVIVIAKDDSAYHNLISQFKDREVEKHYKALLFGRLKEDSGEIRACIGRSRLNRKKMSVRPQRGKEAVTHYRVLERFKPATLADIRIVTGRTHQIRVHFASIGHSVLGDGTYGKKTEVRAGQKVITFPRQMLHAYSLRIKHPSGGEIMEFSAPLPEDMETALNELRKIGN